MCGCNSGRSDGSGGAWQKAGQPQSDEVWELYDTNDGVTRPYSSEAAAKDGKATWGGKYRRLR